MLGGWHTGEEICTILGVNKVCDTSHSEEVGNEACESENDFLIMKTKSGFSAHCVDRKFIPESNVMHIPVLYS
jgi:hypothetical protein